MIKDEAENDLKKFINFNEEKVKLNYSYEFKNIFHKAYFAYHMLSILELKKEDKLTKFIKLSKRDLVSSIDSYYFLHFESSERDFRSLIESILRIVLESYRVYVYSRRKELKIFSASSLLSTLKSMSDTHRIGKFTEYIGKLEINNNVKKCITNLLNDYSNFSNTVHTNTVDQNSRISIDLSSLINHSDKELTDFYNRINNLIDNILCTLYFCLCLLRIENNIAMQDYFYFLALVEKKFDKEFIEYIYQNYDENIHIQD